MVHSGVSDACISISTYLLISKHLSTYWQRLAMEFCPSRRVLRPWKVFGLAVIVDITYKSYDGRAKRIKLAHGIDELS